MGAFQGHTFDGGGGGTYGGAAVFAREAFGKSLWLASVQDVRLGADLPQNLSAQVAASAQAADREAVQGHGGGLAAMERRAFTLVYNLVAFAASARSFAPFCARALYALFGTSR
jgi:hypothetical protein